MKLTIFLFFIFSISLISSVELFRFIQYDKQQQPFGSRTTSFSAPPITFPNETSLDLGPISRFTRYVLLVTFDRIFESKLWTETLQRTDVVSLIVMLPKKYTEKQLEEFKNLEKDLVHKNFEKSIYFCQESDLKSLLERINSNENVQLVVSNKEATVITPVSLYNFQGTLRGSNYKKAPTIAIIANYDTFSMIPELSSGIDINGSGMIALFELSRLFSNLYKNENTKGKYNFVFVLTSGGRFNYQGTKHWLKKIPVSLVDSLDFSLCLEGLLGKELFLHISKKTENKEIIRLYQIFQKTATQLNVPFQVVYKKINTGSHEINWEHEVLSFKKLESATLSHEFKPKNQMTRTPTLEGKFDLKILERNIRFVSESFAKFIYFTEMKNITVFKGSSDVSSGHIKSWIKTFKGYSRFGPTLTGDSALLTGLKKTLSMFTNEVVEQKFELSTDYVFYSNGKVNLEVYTVVPFWFDLVLFVTVVFYALLLHVFFVGKDEAVKNIKSVFGK